MAAPLQALGETQNPTKRRNWHPILQTLQGERFMRMSCSLIDVCHGSLDEAAMVTTAVSWTLTLPTHREGWFYKSIEEWQRETTVKRDRQQRVRRRLRNRSPKFWFEEKRGCPPTNWFRLDLDVLEAELTAAMQRRHAFDDEIEEEPISGKPAHRSQRSISGKPADRSTGIASSVGSEKCSTIVAKPADHSPENTHELSGRSPLHRSRQDTVTLSVDNSAENSEQQYRSKFEETAKSKAISGRFRREYPFPTDPLEREFRAAIYPDQIEKAFFDCQRLAFADQLRTLVDVAATYLTTGRVAKMIGMDVAKPQARAVEKLMRSAAALEYMKDYEARRAQVVQCVMRIVVQEFASEYRGAGCGDESTSQRGLFGEGTVENVPTRTPSPHK